MNGIGALTEMDTADEIELIEGDYEALIKEHGLGKPESVGWRDAGEQRRRLVILKEALEGWELGSVLDVGCGDGAFLRIPGTGGMTTYTGVDMVGEYIERCKGRYGNFHNVEWVQADAIQWLGNTNQKWDTVIASGTLAHYTPAAIHDLVARMFFVTRTTLAFNWNRLTTKFRPEEMLLLLEHVGVERYTLRHDYLTNDYTVYAYKQPE